MGGITDVFQRWFAKPFDPAGDAVDWVLFLGFVAVVLYGWHRVINNIATE